MIVTSYNPKKISYKSEEPKSGLLRKIGIATFLIPVAATLFFGGKKVYESYSKAPEMVKNAKGVKNYVTPGRLWDAYMNEKEMNGFVHNQETWTAYIERTKDLNNRNLNNIQCTPDANGNGRAD